MVYYKRHLPHWQPPGAEYFITFRIAASIPNYILQDLKLYRDKLKDDKTPVPEKRKKIERLLFDKYEYALDKAEYGQSWLSHKKVAAVVKEAIHYHDVKSYDLYCYCIMPNHVHLVFKQTQETLAESSAYPVANILQSIKSYTALESNKILNREGSFWKAENYDRVIRDADELENVIHYTLNNPVKAGLVRDWNDWPHSYCKNDFLETM